MLNLIFKVRFNEYHIHQRFYLVILCYKLTIWLCVSLVFIIDEHLTILDNYNTSKLCVFLWTADFPDKYEFIPKNCDCVVHGGICQGKSMYSMIFCPRFAFLTRICFRLIDL